MTQADHMKLMRDALEACEIEHDFLSVGTVEKVRQALAATAQHEHHGAVAICALCAHVNLKRLEDCPIKLPHVVEHLRKSADYIDSISRSLSYAADVRDAALPDIVAEMAAHKLALPKAPFTPAEYTAWDDRKRQLQEELWRSLQCAEHTYYIQHGGKQPELIRTVSEIRNATLEEAAHRIRSLTIDRKKDDERDPDDELFFEFCDAGEKAIRALKTPTNAGSK